MYETVTYDVLLARMIQNALAARGDIDTREGSLVWLGLAPAAAELQTAYLAMDNVMNETFADTASREHLIRRAGERGLSPYSATPAVLKLYITPTSLSLEDGTRFNIGALNYSVTDSLGSGYYELTCETAGRDGNHYSGYAVIPIDHVTGLSTATITELLVAGDDEEETEAFRKRYYNELNTQYFAGNRADYIQRVMEMSGVGGVRVQRAWSGGGTVLLVLAGKDGDGHLIPPSQTLVNTVKNAVDPSTYSGEGYGLAPIGHVVTVQGATTLAVNVTMTLSYQSGSSWATEETSVKGAISDYLAALVSDEWPYGSGSMVIRVSRMESRILGIPGILDVTVTALNGTAGNLTLTGDQLPTLGTVTVGA